MNDREHSEEIREDRDRRIAVHRRDHDELSADERNRRRELHWMCCPKCGLTLDEIIFRGVRVDKCFGCGGVFLDDGELEQLAGKPGWFGALCLDWGLRRGS